MARSSIILGALLAVSVLLNVVLLTRRSEAPSGAVAVRPVRKEAAAAAPGGAADVPLPVRVPLDAPAALPASSSTASPPPASGSVPSVRRDPRIADVLEAQDRFAEFWKDLDRLFKAKGRVDDAQYFQAAVSATADFLELPATARTHFTEASRAGVAALARSRQEYDQARSALPPRDKNNPASSALYQERKDAVDARYQEQVKAAVNGVRTVLDPARPRHAEFSASAEKWLRNLVPPKPSQP